MTGTKTYAFFGDNTDIHVASANDTPFLDFFYGAFPPAVKGQPAFAVSLQNATCREEGFFNSFLRNTDDLKRITLCSPEGQILVDRTFRGWSEAPTVIPPLSHTNRFTDFALFPACVLSIDGRGVMILGPNYSGKTALLVELCLMGDADVAFVSDNVAYVDVETRAALPAPWPLGFRRLTLERYSSHLRHITTHTIISPVTGKVKLVNPVAFFGKVNETPATIDKVVLLNPVPTETDSFMRVTTQTRPARLPYFSGATHSQVMSMLPKGLTVLSHSPHSSVVSRAELLLQSLQQVE